MLRASYEPCWILSTVEGRGGIVREDRHKNDLARSPTQTAASIARRALLYLCTLFVCHYRRNCNGRLFNHINTETVIIFTARVVLLLLLLGTLMTKTKAASCLYPRVETNYPVRNNSMRLKMFTASNDNCCCSRANGTLSRLRPTVGG